MTKIFSDQAFFHAQPAPGLTYEGFRFEHCFFDNCALQLSTAPRGTLRDISAIECRVWACHVDGAIVDQAVIDGLRTGGGGGRTTPFRIIDAENAMLYRQLDRALDIREAQFSNVSIQGIPSRLIRRDLPTQAVITRTAAERTFEAALERYPKLAETWWPYTIDRFLHGEEEELLLIAPRRHLRFNIQREGIDMLREAGVADPA